MTHLTDKRETLLGAVGISGMSTHRAGLARVVGVYLDRHRAMQEGFIGKHAVQLGKAPFGIRRIGTPLLLTRLFASLAFGSLTNVRQVFQADQAVGVSVNDAFGNDMIGILLQPSLSPSDSHQTAGRGTSAFLLQTLSQSCIMVGFGNQASSRMKSRMSRGIAGHGQVTHAHIYPNHARLPFWHRVGDVSLQGDQQVELLVGFVVAELGGSDPCALLYLGHVVVVASIGQDDPSGQCQDAHPVVRLEAVVMPQLIGQRRGDVLGRTVQSLVAFLRQPCTAVGSVLLGARPEHLVGGSYLSGDRAGHLRRYLETGAYLAVGAVLQPDLVTHLAMLKRIATDVVQRVAIGQLGLPQGLELLRRGLQLEFGDNGLLHRTSVPSFTGSVKRQELMKYPLLPQPQTRNAAFLPVSQARGILRQSSVNDFRFVLKNI